MAEIVPTSKVHVHLSNGKQVKSSHLLSWLLPQITSDESNVLAPLDPDIGRITNDITTIGSNVQLTLSTSLYNIALVLDMSPSMFTVDMDYTKVIVEEMEDVLSSCLISLIDDTPHPWTDESDLPLHINLTVLAFTPQFEDRMISVLVQGYPLTSENRPELEELLISGCHEMYDHIKMQHVCENKSCTVTEGVLYTLITDVLNILRLQTHHEEGGENCKYAMIMITDGVLGETKNTRPILQRLHSRSTSCSFVRVGPQEPSTYGYGYIPNLALLSFISRVSGGVYREWAPGEISIGRVLHWSPFEPMVEEKGLILKPIEQPVLLNASLTSLVAQKLYHGFKISEMTVKDQGLATDFSGAKMTALRILMSMMWRRRIHVIYEILADLPLQHISKLRISLSVCTDCEIVNRLHEDENFKTPIKLLQQLKKFLVNCQTYEIGRKWIQDLHSFAYGSVCKKSLELSRGEVYKINALPPVAPPDPEVDRVHKFWQQLPAEQDSFDANFDVYLFKCWLQFDLSIPKCLTGMPRSRKHNSGTECQIYERSRCFLLDVLHEWVAIEMDKGVRVRLVEPPPEEGISGRASFAWIHERYTSSASMSIYLAMHRDLPFQRQHQLRSDLVGRLRAIKFPGSLSLDCKMKVGFDGSAKESERGGSFLPLQLRAEWACRQLPRHVEDVLFTGSAPKRSNLFLHKLVCRWKTCPDVQCCSDDLIRDLRVEIFNALFRVRLQEQFTPITASGKAFSCMKMLDMKTGAPVPSKALLQYIITVDDEAPELKKEQRKISSAFTSEIWIEPQWGRVSLPSSPLRYIHNLTFPEVLPNIFNLDFELISGLCTFASLKKLCFQPDKIQPKVAALQSFEVAPTTISQPVAMPDLPYLFRVTNLIKRSHMNVIKLPLLDVVPVERSPDDVGSEEVSPNVHLLTCVNELIDAATTRTLQLTEDDIASIKENVIRERKKVGEPCFGDSIPWNDWRCYVRFHKIEGKEDTTRLQFVLLPLPPETTSEETLRSYFPSGSAHVLLFDCFYKILLATFTNWERCDPEKLYECDRYFDRGQEGLEGLECPPLIVQIIEESMSSHSGGSLEKALEFSFVGEVEGAYEKSYILGVHHSILHDIQLSRGCVDTAIAYLQDEGAVKRDRKDLPLSKYLGAVCSHVSGQLSCCFTHTDPMDHSLDSSGMEPNSESYAADGEAVGRGTAGEEEGEDTERREDSEEGILTPLQTDEMWSTARVNLALNTGGRADHFVGEIVSSSAELTPVIPDKRFTDTLKVSGASLDPDSGSDGGEALPTDNTAEPILDSQPNIETPGESLEEKKVSFHESACPLIDVIASTPILGESSPEYAIPLEKHSSIKRKFNEIIDSRFLRMPQYNEQYLVLRAPSSIEDASLSSERPTVFFLRMDCYHNISSTSRPISSLPTCVHEVVGETEKRKREIDLSFTCYILPATVPVSPTIVRSPSVRHRRRDSHRKSEGDRRTERTASYSAHQLSRSLHDDFGFKNYRDQLSGSPASSSPNLSRQQAALLDSDQLVEKSVMEELVREVRWLVADQAVTHLRRRSPVTMETLQQVVEHCKEAPPTAANCTVQTHDLYYVSSWKTASSGEDVRSEERERHEALLAKIQLSPEHEEYNLCRIGDYFYYSLNSENEEREITYRDMSAHSSISSIGSRPSHYRSSSSSIPDIDNPILSTKCSKKPCSQFWLILYVSMSQFQVAFHTCDRGSPEQIEMAVVRRIVEQTLHLNKVQNQEMLLAQMVDPKICPPELLPGWKSNTDQEYVCDVVHVIEVQLWDKDEAEGLREIKESLNLKNFKCGNTDQDVYTYNLDEKNNRDMRSTYYFQLPKPTPKEPATTQDSTSPKKSGTRKLEIEVRGLWAPDPEKQDPLDNFVQQKLEEAKVVDIAHRLNRNNQTKLNVEEIAFLSPKSRKAQRTLYCKIPDYCYRFLPYFWFYLNQHLVQEKLFLARYESNNSDRILFLNELTGKAECARDSEVYIKVKTSQDFRMGLKHQRHEFVSSLLLLNISIVEQSGQIVDFNNRSFNHVSPVFETLCDSTGDTEPSARYHNTPISFTDYLDESSRMSLRLRIIERRKKAGQSHKFDEKFQSSLFQAIQASYISLLLEIWFLPAELTLRNASAIVDMGEDSLSVTPKQPSSMKQMGHSFGRSKGRRSSNESLDSQGEWKDKLRKSQRDDNNSNLHPKLRQRCIEACQVGFELKTKIIKHEVIKIPSIYDSAQVINKITDSREGLSKTFHVRIFDQEDDYRMLPPKNTGHTEEEIQETRILLVARKNLLLNDARTKLRGSALTHLSDTPSTELIAELESGHQEMTSMTTSLEVPRQIHIIVTLEGKLLSFWFYNVQNELRTAFLAEIRVMCGILDTRGLFLSRILLHKLRHELPPHYIHAGLLPESSEAVEKFVGSRDMGVPGAAQGGTFKSKELHQFYEDIYDNYHPGLLNVREPPGGREGEPIARHGLQLATFMQCEDSRKAEEETHVDLDDPDLPTIVTREQAKQLKKNARLLHYIASPLLFSSKLRSSHTDKDTFSYVSSKGNSTAVSEDSDHPAWFLCFKRRLFDRFLEYLKDPMRGIRMTLRYAARSVSKEVMINHTLNDDDNEAILCKDIPGGGRILLGVLIQNSTFCVKLYVLNSDNRLQVFQECSFLMTHTHSYSFSYDWMVHSIYDSLPGHRAGSESPNSELLLPIHHCITSVVDHYESRPEPPHTRCWIKALTEIAAPRQPWAGEIPPRKLFDHIVLNQEYLGGTDRLNQPTLFTVEGAKGSRLLVLIIENRINNYKFALVISNITQPDTRTYHISCYIVLAKQFNNSPPPSLMRETLNIRSRNESMTTISTASTSPGSLLDDYSDQGALVRPRINSEIYRNEAEAKRELYTMARAVAEEELKSLMEAAQQSYRRNDLVQSLIRPSKSSLALELSSNFARPEPITASQLQELEVHLSASQDLVPRDTSLHWLLQGWETGRYKKLLEFLKGRVDTVTLLDTDKSEVCVASRKLIEPGKVDKVAIVVLRHQAQRVSISAIMKKSDQEARDEFHVSFWERVLSLICVYVWERLIA